MEKFFEIVFLEEAFEFLKGLDRKHYEKILYNIVEHRFKTTQSFLKS